jgi:phosphoribosylanthranilate isomerase
MHGVPHHRTLVKVCGVVRPDDAAWLARAGVDAIGMIFALSKRRVSLEQAAAVADALPPWTTRVGVFVDPTLDELGAAVRAARLDVVQVHGDLTGDLEPLALRPVLGATRLVHARAFGLDVHPSTAFADGVDGVVLDGPKAGSGRPFDWATARPTLRRAWNPSRASRTWVGLRRSWTPSLERTSGGEETGRKIPTAARHVPIAFRPLFHSCPQPPVRLWTTHPVASRTTFVPSAP